MSHPVFTPSAADPAELDAMTVGRSELFGALTRRIATAARDGSRPHTLLVAPRGGGKTHTLRVAVHRTLADPTTAEAIVPVWIPEDALAIGSYADLLVEMACAIDPELAITARGHRMNKDVVAIERSILAAADRRMILLAIENVDRVFDSIGQAGQGSLRAWVETSSSVMIFATAPLLFAGISSRSFPWYGSFMVEHLPELTPGEGAALLALAARRRGDNNLTEFADSPEGHDRLHVIHRMAGGSPRLWHILADCIDATSLDELVPAVESLLDRLAPYYQQRLWQLPAGERRLVVELARGWQPRTVGDLAAAVGVTNQSAATALGRLASSHWVRSDKADSGDKRASWYDLTEPLLRYHVHYRESHGKPLRLIVEFLRACYSRDQFLAELDEAVRDSSLQPCKPGGGDGFDSLAGLGDKGRDAEVASAYWARTVAKATNLSRPPVPSAKDAGTGIVAAVYVGIIGWADLPRIMSALPKNAIPDVALHIALTARAADIELPSEDGPMDYLDADDRAFVAFADKLRPSQPDERAQNRPSARRVDRRHARSRES